MLEADDRAGATPLASASKRGLIAAAVAVLVLGAASVWWFGRHSTSNGADPLASTPAVGENQPADEKSIAVLPFANLSADPDQEYFSAGISEELLNLLAHVPDLRVMARTSTLAAAEQGGSIAEIAARLGVAHVLEGSVRRAGNRVRISAQLVHAADGFQKWSQTWDRTLDDIFAIQDEIARDTLEQLESTLLGDYARNVHTTDPEAYALYLQALQIGGVMTVETLQQSNDMLARVLEIDPGYIPAHLRRYANLANSATFGASEAVPELERLARAELELALAKDPEDPRVLATIARQDLRTDTSTPLPDIAARIRSALERAPTDPSILNVSRSLLLTLGRNEEALEVTQWLARRDPLNTVIAYNLSGAFWATGRPTDCIQAAETAIRLGRSSGTYSLLANCQLQLGKPQEALASVEQELHDIWRMETLPKVLHDLGRFQDAKVALADLIDRWERVASFNIAYIYAYQGQADRAFEWLDKAVEYEDTGLTEIIFVPDFANLYDDPRWVPFLRRIGRAPEQIDHIEFTVDLPGS